MIKIENVKVEGFDPAIRGMRNPKNSWDKSDSHVGLCGDEWSLDPGYIIGEADKKLMTTLSKGGSVHAKYRRMIVVWCDITAPSYWWAEFDTYRFGRERNSCSFMHKGTAKPFEIVDFSYDGIDNEETYKTLTDVFNGDGYKASDFIAGLDCTWGNVINMLNDLRELYLKTKDDRIFQMIRRLLPSGYNIRATIMMNYEVLANAYHWRKNHRLDEWREFCKWAETLPYSWCFTLKEPVVEQEETETDDNPPLFTMAISSLEIMDVIKHTEKMTLYLDGIQIGHLFRSDELLAYADSIPVVTGYELNFLIDADLEERVSKEFFARVKNLQSLQDDGKLKRHIDYDPVTNEPRMCLTSW